MENWLYECEVFFVRGIDYYRWYVLVVEFSIMGERDNTGELVEVIYMDN